MDVIEPGGDSAVESLSASEAEARRRLVELLCEASELEHSLCLQYLFAAFSLRTRSTEPGVDSLEIEKIRYWKADLLLIAREEMLHLALVTNMLAAVGAGPYLRRPNFPQPARYYPVGVVAALEPLSLPTVERFLVYEQPAALSGGGGDVMTVGQLYERVRDLVMAIEEDRLFIGSARRQVDATTVLDPLGLFDDDVRTGYGVEPFAVTDRPSALHAIDLIVEQGEGCGEAGENSHYARLLRIREELRSAQLARADFQPSRPVLPNPVVEPRPDAPDANPITHPVGLEAAALFNCAYGLVMLMLLRFHARTDAALNETAELQRILFFPLMTMVVRPLGEILTELPAVAGESALAAGPTFEFGRDIELIPDPRVARRVFAERLEELQQRGRWVADAVQRADVDPHLRERTRFLAENLERMAAGFHGEESPAQR
jgi:hypothetical protein